MDELLDDPVMRLSHNSLYIYLYVLIRGEYYRGDIRGYSRETTLQSRYPSQIIAAAAQLFPLRT